MSRLAGRVWAAVLIITALCLSSTVLFARWQSTPLFWSLSKTGITGVTNPWQLHPEQHISRQATTLRYFWRITSEQRRPDGVLKTVYLINGQFPGPTIEARPGDKIVMEVENALIAHNESVSLHWHGLTMRGFNHMDGAAGVTQDAIACGQRFTYEFDLDTDRTGTFWYHAHSGSQRADGLYGGLVVHDPAQKVIDSEYMLMIGDWYHRSAEEILKWYLDAGSFGMEPVPDSILINGQGIYNCDNAVPARPLNCRHHDTDLSSLHFDGAAAIRLRIVNVGAYAGFSTAFSGQDLRVLAVDGGNAVQSLVSSKISTLYPGQRVDVLVDELMGNTNLSISLATERFKYSNPALTSTQDFVLSLKHHKQPNQAALAQERPPIEVNSLNMTMQPFDQDFEADMTLLLYTMTEKLAHLDYVPHGNINRTLWAPQTPSLISTSRESWDENQFVPHIPYDADKPKWVDLVVNNLDEDDHPFHIHGHDLYVMQMRSANLGWGSWNPYEDGPAPGGEYNQRPPKRDTVLVPRRGYAVLRFRADNPGLWMFHCHVMWHLAGGMAMAFEVS